MPDKIKLEYIGMDSWDRPVYKDEHDRFWKDLDSREYETEMCATNEENRKLQQATDEIAKLKLDSRSLVYSVVEVRTDFGYRCFLLPGICDRDALESSEQYQELMEDAEDTEVNTSVHSYSVGTGESERPDEAELEIIEQYTDELDEKYGVDSIQSDFISFYYEAEQEF